MAEHSPPVRHIDYCRACGRPVMAGERRGLLIAFCPACWEAKQAARKAPAKEGDRG